MPLSIITPPAVEPVDLATAKRHLVVDEDMTDDDALIQMLITAARAYAESYTGRSFITQQWRLVADNWPGRSSLDIGCALGTYSLPPSAFQLERGPVQSVDSIKYLDSGTLYTLPTSAYVADLTGVLPRVAPAFGQIWPPISTPQIGNVQVNYTAGYGSTATSVPPGICQWLLMRIGTLYQNREEVVILSRGRVEALPFVDRLLDPYCLLLA